MQYYFTFDLITVTLYKLRLSRKKKYTENEKALNELRPEREKMKIYRAFKNTSFPGSIIDPILEKYPNTILNDMAGTRFVPEGTLLKLDRKHKEIAVEIPEKIAKDINEYTAGSSSRRPAARAPSCTSRLPAAAAAAASWQPAAGGSARRSRSLYE